MRQPIKAKWLDQKVLDCLSNDLKIVRHWEYALDKGKVRKVAKVILTRAHELLSTVLCRKSSTASSLLARLWNFWLSRSADT